VWTDAAVDPAFHSALLQSRRRICPELPDLP
jgi:hypothetical protein